MLGEILLKMVSVMTPDDIRLGMAEKKKGKYKRCLKVAEMANEVESVRQLTSEIEGCISDAEGELL